VVVLQLLVVLEELVQVMLEFLDQEMVNAQVLYNILLEEVEVVEILQVQED
tara:strand:- start:153 stop:305 length:153 start_codon:yes stop_codon:yes gene_type:complete